MKCWSHIYRGAVHDGGDGAPGLIPEGGGIHLKDAIEAFLRFTDKPAIASKEAVVSGVAQACADGQLGIGRGSSLSDLHARYCRQSVSLDATEEGVWIIPPFEPAPPLPSTRAETTTGAGQTYGTRVVESSTLLMRNEGAESKEDAKQPSARQITIRGAVPLDSWPEIFRCFVGPAARMNLKRLNLGIHFELEASPDVPLAADHPSVKAIQEAARQLGLSVEIEE